MIPELTRYLELFAVKCNGSGFLGFPTWYKYLENAAPANKPNQCSPELRGLNDIWLIALAVSEILLRVAIIVAIVYVLIGGFKYITSRANPDKTNSAKNTVIDALIGLVLALVATAVISFIAGRFQG